MSDTIPVAPLSTEQVTLTELGGEKILSVLTCAPGNSRPIGGIKVATANGWFAVRPSGTEDIYKIYAESFLGDDHLHRILEEAQGFVGATLATAAARPVWSAPAHPQTDEEAIEVWENEGDPN